jgi:hypothetical protein
MIPHDSTDRHSLIGRALDWWQEVRDSWQRMHELEMLSDFEIERMARDVGVTTDELLRMATLPQGASDLLDRRLAALSLDPEDVGKLSSLLMADLRRTCALCSEKARCAEDLDQVPQERHWEAYCPNAGTLRTLT